MYMEIWTNILNVDSDFEGHANLQFKRKKKKKTKIMSIRNYLFEEK